MLRRGRGEVRTPNCGCLALSLTCEASLPKKRATGSRRDPCMRMCGLGSRS